MRQNYIPIFRKLLPVQHHKYISNCLYNSFRTRISNRKHFDLKHCRNIERSMLCNRLLELDNKNFNPCFQPLLKQTWVHLEPICLALNDYIHRLVPVTVINERTPNVYDLIRYSLLLHIMKIPLHQTSREVINNTWGIV